MIIKRSKVEWRRIEMYSDVICVVFAVNEVNVCVVLVRVRYIHGFHGGFSLCGSYLCRSLHCSVNVISAKMLHCAIVILFDSFWSVIGGEN